MGVHMGWCLPAEGATKLKTPAGTLNCRLYATFSAQKPFTVGLEYMGNQWQGFLAVLCVQLGTHPASHAPLDTVNIVATRS